MPIETTDTPETRSLSTIAREIIRLWTPEKIKYAGYAARPYLYAMIQLDQITDMYGADSADDIVRRFLGNARSWRGEDARRIKAELKAMLRR